MVDKSPEAFRTISEVGVDLNIPQHVLRFWETRFTQIRPLKRSGGRRYYRPDDVDLIKAIRHLLYGQGYTIRGVQRILKEQGARAVIARTLEAAADPSALPPAPSIPMDDDESESTSAHESDDALNDESKDPSILSFDDAHRLKSALFELNDGIRLLRQALGEQD